MRCKLFTVLSLSLPITSAFAQGTGGVIFVDPPVQEMRTKSGSTQQNKQQIGNAPSLARQKAASPGAIITQGTLMGSLAGAAGLVVGIIGGFALSSERGNIDHTALIAVGALGMGTFGMVSGVGLAARWNRGRCSIWGRVAGGVVGLGLAGVVGEASPFVGAFMPAMGASIGCYKTYQPNHSEVPPTSSSPKLYELP